MLIFPKFAEFKDELEIHIKGSLNSRNIIMNYRYFNGINPYKFSNYWRSINYSDIFASGKKNARKRRKWLREQYKKGYRSNIDVILGDRGIRDPYYYRTKILVPQITQIQFTSPLLTISANQIGKTITMHSLVIDKNHLSSEPSSFNILELEVDVEVFFQSSNQEIIVPEMYLVVCPNPYSTMDQKTVVNQNGQQVVVYKTTHQKYDEANVQFQRMFESTDQRNKFNVPTLDDHTDNQGNIIPHTADPFAETSYQPGLYSTIVKKPIGTLSSQKKTSFSQHHLKFKASKSKGDITLNESDGIYVVIQGIYNTIVQDGEITIGTSSVVKFTKN